MTPAEIAQKLAIIRALKPGEIDGYETEAKRRGMFDGEAAALLARRLEVMR